MATELGGVEGSDGLNSAGPLPKPKLRGKVSSDARALTLLHAYYPWLPTEETVRPSEAGKAAKAARLEEIISQYVDIKDYLLHTVFGRDVELSSEGKLFATNAAPDPTHVVFAANEFPYAIEQGNHSIFWFCVRDKPNSDEEITRDIERELARLVNSTESFDFAWYENPHMSVPEFYHVQVFWVSA